MAVHRAASVMALKRIAYKAAAERMLTLGDLVDLVAGRTALVLELKSRFDGDLRLAARTAAVLARTEGPVAVMSFDPTLVIALRQRAPHLVRGMWPNATIGRRIGTCSEGCGSLN